MSCIDNLFILGTGTRLQCETSWPAANHTSLLLLLKPLTERGLPFLVQ
jgi:hypothetical protein